MGMNSIAVLARLAGCVVSLTAYVLLSNLLFDPYCALKRLIGYHEVQACTSVKANGRVPHPRDERGVP